MIIKRPGVIKEIYVNLISMVLKIDRSIIKEFKNKEDFEFLNCPNCKSKLINLKRVLVDESGERKVIGGRTQCCPNLKCFGYVKLPIKGWEIIDE